MAGNRKFVEGEVAVPGTQRYVSLRRFDWDRLRELIERCKKHDRDFRPAAWGVAGIAFTALFSTGGFVLIEHVPEWLLRLAIAVTAGATMLAAGLFVANHFVRVEKTERVADAVAFMDRCSETFGEAQ